MFDLNVSIFVDNIRIFSRVRRYSFIRSTETFHCTSVSGIIIFYLRVNIVQCTYLILNLY